MRGRTGGSAFILGVLLLASVARADEHPMSVVLTLTGAPDEVTELDASVRELLTRLSLDVVPEADDPLARVTVVLGEAECTASITNRAGELVSFRRVPRGPSAQVTLEAVAHVVQSAVEELAELERNPLKRRVKVAEPSPPPVVEVPVVETKLPPPRPREGLGLELGALASGRGFGDGSGVVFGGGVVVSLARHGESRWRPVGSFLATYNGPFVTESDIADVSTQTVSLRVLGGVRLQASRRWAFEAQAGGGVDGFVLEARSTALPPNALLRPRLEASPVLTASLTARFAPTETTSVFLGVSADVDLLPRRLVTEVQGTREVLFEAWRVRPTLVLGFSFDVLGGAR